MLRYFITLACLSTAGAREWELGIEGHARTMYESYDNIDFGLGPVADDDWIHQRVQLMARLDRGEAFRFAAELTWGEMSGKESPLAPPDEDEPDLLQLYLQGRVPLGGADALELRAGRQTLYYGSGRLLAAREGANQRLSHDAVLLSWQRGEDTRVDAFIASPVEVEPGSFDNASRPHARLLWSLYAVAPLPWGRDHFVDLYYIGLRDEDAIGIGQETRHTLGARFWREEGPWIHNTELIGQFGSIGERDIAAGAISLGFGRRWESLPWQPTPQLRADLISGGDDGRGTVHTFNPLFQANNYFNEGGFLSPSNLYNLNPLVSLKPCESVELQLGVNFQWLFSRNDAIYTPPLQPLVSPDPQGDRYLGTSFNASVSWQLRENVELFLGYTHLQAGDALEAVGGRDVDYLQSSFRVAF
ncbi:alginate export family protein [Luteolibacter sp. GHJ8]|uniref:Alginate export family protein n=1 Tax=Luteolibacter rhizosphaerae TaxID=2989719 RepID=A0ABT3GB79_9BACT|nr:alginate export family protein [Luteolibacter rhizosphaerae]MCW1916490.1 alginate export family protein [Luteolibacter rhizosphaerae]